MIIQCPECYSENVTRLSADSNEFICDDCGHNFEDNDELDGRDGGASFINLDPAIAMLYAQALRNNSKDENEQLPMFVK